MASYGVKVVGLKELHRAFGPAITRGIIRGAMTKLSTAARVEASRAIRRHWAITNKKITKYSAKGKGVTMSRRIHGNVAVFTLEASAQKLPLIAFSVTPSSASTFINRKRGRGVRFTVRRGERHHAPGAFVARMPGGHEGVFMRKQGAARLPIRELLGASVGDMLQDRRTIDSVIDRVRDDIPGVVSNQIDRAKAKARVRRV